MKKIGLFLLLLISSFSFLKADEGMWIPLFIEKYNIEQMQQKGFKLTAKDIYDVNQASIKDAVMIFGGGCTAELISDKGLILTNHHCGYSRIQAHSSIENDYLTDGFWAGSMEEELSNPGLTVTFLVYMEDVTERVMSVFNENMSMTIRQIKIDSVCTVIESEIEKKHNDKYEALVESFFYGNQYIVMVTEVFRDIRLVGAPPSSIGKFGGDTDNWVWPRHTGDFSLFRIYADKNNQPADYSPDNVPYKPKKYFTIDISGIKEGDFTMIFGYPGYTQQYIPSFTIDNIINMENPDKIAIRDIRLQIINKAMQADRKTRIMYAAKQSSIANGWKKWIGQNIGLKRINIIKQKQEYELKFQQWADASDDRNIYKNLLSDYEKLEQEIKTYQKAQYYFIECIYYTDVWDIYYPIYKKIDEIDKTTDIDKIDSLKQNALTAAENLLKDFDAVIDKEIFNEMMKLYFNNLDKEFYPAFYSKIQTDFNGSIEEYVDFLYENSILVDKTKLKDFINGFYNGNTKYKKKNKDKALYTMNDFSNDPYVVLFNDFRSVYTYQILPHFGKMVDIRDSLDHLYMQGQMKMEPDKIFYPDANFTLRIAYGSVKGFRPKDGLIYDYYTTLDGVIEKDNPEIYDYNVPEKLKKLYYAKDFGNYANEEGKMPVCFIADNHTSGGNSGSPVINAKGQLIGINFDRCWESTMSDIEFDPNYCRNITLDIRYVLFIIDKFAGAGYLLDEMTIVKE